MSMTICIASNTGLVSFLFAGAAYTGKANIAYASAPVQTESVQIIDTVARRRRRGNSFYVDLPTLAQGSLAASRMRIDYSDYQRYRSGQTCTCATAVACSVRIICLNRLHLLNDRRSHLNFHVIRL